MISKSDHLCIDYETEMNLRKLADVLRDCDPAYVRRLLQRIKSKRAEHFRLGVRKTPPANYRPEAHRAAGCIRIV